MASSTLLAILKFNDQFSSAYSRAIRNMTEGQKKVQNQMKQLSTIGSNLQNVGKSITTAVTVPLVGLGTASVKSAMDFNASIENIMTLQSKLKAGSTKTLEEIRTEAETTVLNLSNKYAKSANDVAQAYFNMSSGLADASQVSKAMDSALKLSVVGQTDAAQSVSALAAAYNTYGDELHDFESIANIILKTQTWGTTTIEELGETMGQVMPTAKSMGVTIEDLYSGIAVLTSAGISTAEAVTYMKNALNKATTNGDRKKLANGGLLDYLEEVSQKYPEYENVLDKFSNVRAVAGIVSLKDNKDLFKQYREEISKTDGELENVFKGVESTSLHSFNSALNKLKNNMIEIGNKLMPTVNTALEKLNNFLDSITQEDINNFVELAKVLVTIGPIIWGIGTACSVVAKVQSFGLQLQLLTSMAKSASGTLPTVANNATTVGTSIKGMATTMTTAINSVAPLVATVATWGTVFAVVGSAISATVSGAKGWATDADAQAKKVAQELANDKSADPMNRMRLQAQLKSWGYDNEGNKIQTEKVGQNANGTDNWRGGLTRINEIGGEVVNLPKGTQITPASKSRNITINIPKLAESIVVRSEADIDAIVDKLGSMLQMVYANS